MAAQGIRRLPVVDGNGNLFGIVTLDDLLRQLALPLAELSELAVREIRYESRTRT
jgi:CBS domain-containing protein